MDTVFIIGLGLAVGFFARHSSLPRMAGSMSGMLVCALVFLLGRELALDMKLSNVDSVALNALLVTTGAVVGSIAATILTEYVFFRK